MGGTFSGGAPVGDAAGAATTYPVSLNVYDLTPINNYLHWCGLGIFHSAVEVHGSEYSFGAHDYPSSGVFEVEPKNCPGFIYRCTIFIGSTNDLSTRLTGKPIPGWVNRLARLGAFCNCLLPESMRLEATETKNLADCRFSDDSHTTSNDNFDEEDLEDKHLLPTSSVGEDAIVKEVHR
ncbi:unnamed protein product [Urochloa humidicola]